MQRPRFRSGRFLAVPPLRCRTARACGRRRKRRRFRLRWQNPPCSSAIKFLEGNPSVDWGDIEQSALDGEPVSQYCMALKCDSLAKIRYNGERKKLRRSEIMFLLLSSKKGNYEKANVALTPLLSSEIEVDLEDVKQMNLIVDQILATIDKGK